MKAAIGVLGMLVFTAAGWAQEEISPAITHPECIFFGAKAEHFSPLIGRRRPVETELTNRVASLLPRVAGAIRPVSLDGAQVGTIDSFIFGALDTAAVAPAPTTNDYEFIRRATLDLTGRIPTAARVASFAADSSPDKRAKLVDELLAKPEWIDKWTMFFGDLYQNNSRNSQVRRYPSGVKAFNDSIRAALKANKPYNLIATDLIAATGNDSYTNGALNYLVGGVVTGGPIQDIFDQQTANIFTQFMGMSHVNCLLCHNGRGHLDALSLWGSQTTRYQAWQLSSYLSHTDETRTAAAGAVNNQPYYWNVVDNTARARTDYALNTTTGNRPARQPVGSQRNVAPLYIFNNDKPKGGESYRTALARAMTSDLQFARATVNYFWAYFFGVGLVDPPDQFDPARLDPDNPPPSPWTLQPSNPQLLNALAQEFMDNKYDLQWLMRTIVNSKAYQLSSRYNGDYNATWDALYARHLVRRLWAEEVHDAIAQSSNIIPTYNVQLSGTLNWAMQFPEPLNTPTAGNPVTPFLDAFLRGNRDDQTRSGDGSILQALGLMNDNFVMSRTRSNGPASSLLVSSLNQPNTQLVDSLYMAVLSRHPSTDETTAAVSLLTAGARNQQAENLLWSLYNKVDFIFNY